MNPRLQTLATLFEPLLTPGIRQEDLESGREWLRAALEPVAAADLTVAMIGPDTAFRQDHEGVDGFIEGFGDWLGSFETFRLELDELIELDDCVVTLVRQYATPSGGSVEVENIGTSVWWFRDALLVGVEFHLDRDTGLRAAGLDPQRIEAQSSQP